MDNKYSGIEWSAEVQFTTNREGIPAWGCEEFSTCCACGLWSLFLVGCFGWHRLYLGEPFSCLLQFFTLGLGMTQTFKDFCSIDEMVNERNSEIRSKVNANRYGMRQAQMAVIVRETNVQPENIPVQYPPQPPPPLSPRHEEWRRKRKEWDAEQEERNPEGEMRQAQMADIIRETNVQPENIPVQYPPRPPPPLSPRHEEWRRKRKEWDAEQEKRNPEGEIRQAQMADIIRETNVQPENIPVQYSPPPPPSLSPRHEEWKRKAEQEEKKPQRQMVQNSESTNQHTESANQPNQCNPDVMEFIERLAANNVCMLPSDFQCQFVAIIGRRPSIAEVNRFIELKNAQNAEHSRESVTSISPSSSPPSPSSVEHSVPRVDEAESEVDK